MHLSIHAKIKKILGWKSEVAFEQAEKQRSVVLIIGKVPHRGLLKKTKGDRGLV